MVWTSSRNTPTWRALESLFARERPRLVHLCRRLTGNSDVAEDLAQETLLEAWRNLYKFHGEQGESWSKWLSAIARNVCKRWIQMYYQEATFSTILSAIPDRDDWMGECSESIEDVEIELEREELVHVLDRALGLLPSSARDVLIERYVNELSHKEIGERLNLSEDALVQRLYRGKKALRRILMTQLRAEASELGILTEARSSGQQATRISCPLCGKGQLLNYHNLADHLTGFTCPRCGNIAGWLDEAPALKSFKVLFNRQMSCLEKRYWGAIEGVQAPCFSCRRPLRTTVCYSQDTSRMNRSVHVPATSLSCDHCGHVETNTLALLTLDMYEVRQFWHRHARMFWLPERVIDFSGRAALVSSFQSLVDTAQLDVIIDQATFKVLSIHEGSFSYNKI